MTKTSPLVFIQIPKTASNAFHAYLRGLHRRLSWNMLSFTAASSVLATPQVPLEYMVRREIPADQFDIISGHIPFGTVRICFPHGDYFTVLREPVDRLLSDYCSQPAHSEEANFGLGRFGDVLAARPSPEFAHDNMQVRMLADNPRFGREVEPSMLDEAISNLSHRFFCFGILEQMDDFLHRFAALRRIPAIDLPKLHVSGDYQDYVTEEIRDLAARHNELDTALYDWVKRELAARQISDPPLEDAAIVRETVEPVSIPYPLPETPAPGSVRIDAETCVEVLLSDDRFIVLEPNSPE